MLVVDGIDAARHELISRGVDVSEVWHGETGSPSRRDGGAGARRPDPERGSYKTWTVFTDPDRAPDRTGVAPTCETGHALDPLYVRPLHFLPQRSQHRMGVSVKPGDTVKH
jgi:hypothetical protein